MYGDIEKQLLDKTLANIKYFKTETVTSFLIL